ncbi:MAG: efflux RND transporter permease subunit, partial [bacterium]|nr:efflux RND transporter permease subunit [bacterium]
MKAMIAWFARNRVAANLLMVALIVVGIAAYPSIEQKSFPDLENKIIQIAIPYLGAAPEEVENGVCIRVEEAIQSINGIEQITSVAAEGACTVSAELVEGYSEERAQSEIKNAIDTIDNFPEEIETPIVAQWQLRRMAIQIALSGDAGERALKVYGQRIRDELVAIDGITQVDLRNVRSYEISIEVSEADLRRYALTFDDVVQ